MPEEQTELDPELSARMQVLGNYVASCTVLFDDFFLVAANARALPPADLAAEELGGRLPTGPWGECYARI